MHLMEDDADTSGYSGTFSEPTVLRSVVPGANGVATAGDLARFYAMMERKGSLDGATVIQSATAEEAVEFQVEGVDKSIGVFVPAFPWPAPPVPWPRDCGPISG